MFILKLRGENEPIYLDNKIGEDVRNAYHDKNIPSEEKIKLKNHSFSKGQISSIRQDESKETFSTPVPEEVVKEVWDATQGINSKWDEFCEKKPLLIFAVDKNGRKYVTSIHDGCFDLYETYKKAFDTCKFKKMKNIV